MSTNRKCYKEFTSKSLALQITVREKKMLNVGKDISNKVLPTDSKIRLGDYVEIL